MANRNNKIVSLFLNLFNSGSIKLDADTSKWNDGMNCIMTNGKTSDIKAFVENPVAFIENPAAMCTSYYGLKPLGYISFKYIKDNTFSFTFTDKIDSNKFIRIIPTVENNHIVTIYNKIGNTEKTEVAPKFAFYRVMLKDNYLWILSIYGLIRIGKLANNSGSNVYIDTTRIPTKSTSNNSVSPPPVSKNVSMTKSETMFIARLNKLNDIRLSQNITGTKYLPHREFDVDDVKYIRNFTNNTKALAYIKFNKANVYILSHDKKFYSYGVVVMKEERRKYTITTTASKSSIKFEDTNVNGCPVYGVYANTKYGQTVNNDSMYIHYRTDNNNNAYFILLDDLAGNFSASGRHFGSEDLIKDPNDTGGTGGSGNDNAVNQQPEPLTLMEELLDGFGEDDYSEEVASFDETYGFSYAPDIQARSFNSVIGLPFQFLNTADPRIGGNRYGKQYVEEILYDMPLAILRPGSPTMSPNDTGNSGLVGNIMKYKNLYNTYMKGKGFKSAILGEDNTFSLTPNSESDVGLFEQIFADLFIGKYSRFYMFVQNYTLYVEYVNTLCHLFAAFLDIGEKYYVTNNGKKVKYINYDDTWETAESDDGASIRNMYGGGRGIYVYYEPDSSINRTFSNQTKVSELEGSVNQLSSVSKEWQFVMGAAGIGNGSFGQGLFDFSALQSNLSGALGRLFANASEGITTILTGNRMDMPDIYDDSTNEGQINMRIKLVSPYGDRESIFLYVLRPLARLLAFSVPRQLGPNSYTSPFIVQAFSKGQFNVQLGIVDTLSVEKCGNGGESYSVNNIPTELEVSLTISDLYDFVSLSNEYVGTKITGFWTGLMNALSAVNPLGSTKAAKLLFNNIGLIDFAAAYCGFNLNMPSQDVALTLLSYIYENRVNDNISSSTNKLLGFFGYKSPKWSRQMMDQTANYIQKATLIRM